MRLDLNLETVKDFALDVWEDLGRTRLAGVAVGLSVALLMITTAVLLRPGGETDVEASSPVIAPTTPEEDVSFAAPDDEPMELADIDLSAPRDPFRSLDGLAASDQTLLPAGEQILDSVTSVSSTGSTSTGVTTGDTTALMPLDDLSTTPTSTTPSDEPQGDFGETDDTHEPADATPVTDYSYTADVQFGQVDDLHRYATVQRLGLLPSRREPLIMYLGVTTDHDTAVFMVDSRLSQGGEGTCVPRDSLCTFLELEAGNPARDEHHFMDADGNEYLLRLRGLTRTTNSSGSLTGQSVSALRGTPPVVDGER